MAAVTRPRAAPRATMGSQSRVTPLSLEALVTLLSESAARDLGTLPVLGGHGAVVSAAEERQVIDLSALPASVVVEPERGLVTATATATWAEVDKAAQAAGLTLDLVGVTPWRSVGGTLSEAALLPPLWLSGAPASRLVGMEALRPNGEAYRAPAFPRTSSGPDWKGAWLGREGRAGVLVSCTFEALRTARTALTLDDPTMAHAAFLQRLLTTRPSTLRVQGWRAGVWLIDLVGHGALTEVTHAELRALGAVAGHGPAPRQGMAAGLMVAPWSVLSSAQERGWPGLEIDAAGPTHVRLVLPLARRRAAESAYKMLSTWSETLAPRPVRLAWRRWRPGYTTDVAEGK